MEPVQTTDILGVHYAVTSLPDVLARMEANKDAWRGAYICAGNVHTTVMAHDDPAFARVENGSVLTVPDGKPLVLVQRRMGFPQAGHVPVTTLMDWVFRDGAMAGRRHFFYGSRQETLEKLVPALEKTYPGIVIAGAEPSVFRPMTREENDALVERINAAAPDILWVGLGAPRQENWMAENRGKVQALMVGVGGGFDCFAGNVKRAPEWMQKLCLEWLYRLLQEPRRLFKRYFVTNTRFLWLMAKAGGRKGKT